MVAGRALQRQIDRGRGRHRFMHHAAMALNHQVWSWPSRQPDGGTQELVHEEVEHRPPLEVLAELRAIEQEILQGIDELEGMLR